MSAEEDGYLESFLGQFNGFFSSLTLIDLGVPMPLLKYLPIQL